MTFEPALRNIDSDEAMPGQMVSGSRLATYVSVLRELVDRSKQGLSGDDIEAVERALADGPMVELRRSRSLSQMRSVGSFFTGAAITKSLWGRLEPDLVPRSIVLDPAVGAGDLLLSAARWLKSHSGPSWQEQVIGLDIDDQFLAIARARLALATGALDTTQDFRGLRRHDFLMGAPAELGVASHVVMNPPFVNAIVANDDAWGGGRVNLSAVFVERALAAMKPGARLLAILPDVLRSGSRYENWRGRIAAVAEQIELEDLGQFDRQTDVHVFLMDLRKAANAGAAKWPKLSDWTGPTVGDHFHVGVGSVVPHRHSDHGRHVPYLAVSDLPGDANLDRVARSRGYGGRLDQGPMVLVRRTSRPAERPRAKATLYTGHLKVAVENHLLVLRPRSDEGVKCEDLLRVLKSESTSRYLDNAIRLRHLTVGAVMGIPWCLE